jgi:hypothetical protein
MANYTERKLSFTNNKNKNKMDRIRIIKKTKLMIIGGALLFYQRKN